jgi:ABC-type Na+ efflux pump permease subunit
MFGPLYHYELVRLARKGHGTVMRCAYALVILTGLLFTYSAHFPGHNLLAEPFASRGSMPAGDMARLAGAFTAVILAVQNVAVLVLTPAYLAGAVAGEKERGTLELLFTTHLSDREIVLGKLAARVTHLGGVLLAGLPLLAITQVWGGVDIFLLSAAFLAAVLNLIAAGSVCMACSVRSTTVIGALGSSYTAVAVLTVLYFMFGWTATSCGLFETLRERPTGAFVSLPVRSVGDLFGPIPVCVLCNGLVALVGVVCAVFDLRSFALRQAEATAPAVAAPRPAGPVPAASGQLRPLPPVGRWPLLWKETNRGKQHFSPAVERLLERYWLALVIIPALVGWLFSVRFDRVPGQGGVRTLDQDLRIFLAVCGVIVFVVFAIGWCWDVAFRSATSVCREREQKTLDALLTVPASRSAVLGAKWLGSILAARVGYVVMFAAVYTVGCGALPLQKVPLLTLALASQVAVLASLGVRVSVASRTTLRAQVVMAVLLLVLFCGGWVAPLFDAGAEASMQAKAVPLTKGTARALVYDVGINPVGGWLWTFHLTRWETSQPSGFERAIDARRDEVMVYAALACGLAAAVLFLDACRCLRAGQKG